MLRVSLIKPYIYINIYMWSSLLSTLIMWNRFQRSFNKPTGCGNRQSFIQTTSENCEKMHTEVLAFSHTCDLEWRSKSYKLAFKCSGLYHFSKLERNQPVNVQMQANVKVLLTKDGWLFVGCLTSQQHASVSQEWICSDKFTCCHTEIEVADQTFHLTQSQYTDTGPTSLSVDPITPDAWQGSHWSANFEVTGMTRPQKNHSASGIRTRDFRSWGGRLNH